MFVALISSWQVHPVSSLPLFRLRNMRDLDQLLLRLTLSNKHTQVKTSLLAWIQLIDNNHFTKSVILQQNVQICMLWDWIWSYPEPFWTPSTCISEFEFIPLEQLHMHATLQLFRNKYSYMHADQSTFEVRLKAAASWASLLFQWLSVLGGKQVFNANYFQICYS